MTSLAAISSLLGRVGDLADYFETTLSVSIGSLPESLEGPASDVDVIAIFLSIEANRVSSSGTTVTFSASLVLESSFCVTFLQTLEVFSSSSTTSPVVSDVCSVRMLTCRVGLATSKCSSPMTLMRQAAILQ